MAAVCKRLSSAIVILAVIPLFSFVLSMVVKWLGLTY